MQYAHTIESPQHRVLSLTSSAENEWLAQVLGDMPQKTFEFTRRAEATHPLDLPSTATPEEALDRVLRLPAVASKRFLTTKVDRCVTGGACHSLLLVFQSCFCCVIACHLL
jgi:phosphoribosylformylglycinamidine (FGAM) synthase-like enzyme